MALEVFTCTRLNDSKLTRTSCGARHRAANESGRGGQGLASVRESACRECPIGAAHLRGEAPTTWPNGAPIVVAPLVALGTPPPPKGKTSSAVQVGGHGARFVRAPRAGAAPIQTGAPPTTAPPAPPAPEARTSMEITHKGKTQSVEKWAEHIGMSSQALRARIKRGWTETEAIETPKGDLPKRFLEHPTAPQHKAAAKKVAASTPGTATEVAKSDSEPPTLVVLGGREVEAERALRGLEAVAGVLGLGVARVGVVGEWQILAVRQSA